MSPWGWTPVRSQGIWRHGPLWFRPLVQIAPWASAALCYLTMYVAADSLTVAKGELFDLPAAGLAEGESTTLVAIVLPLRNEATVIFDDARYTIGDGTSLDVFGEHLAERLAKARKKTLLVLADRRISHGDLSQLVGVARTSGVRRVLLANKQGEEDFDE